MEALRAALGDGLHGREHAAATAARTCGASGLIAAPAREAGTGACEAGTGSVTCPLVLPMTHEVVHCHRRASEDSQRARGRGGAAAFLMAQLALDGPRRVAPHAGLSRRSE